MNVGKLLNISQWLSSDNSVLNFASEISLGSWKAIECEVPKEYHRVIAFLDAILIAIEPSFRGALLNVSDFPVSTETATIMIFDKIRSLAVHPPVVFSESPATILDGNEYDDFYALMLLILLGHWDATVGIRGAYCVVKAHHHGFCQIAAQDDATIVQIQHRLNDAKFQYSAISGIQPGTAG